MKQKKELIEVALPLEAINAASAREKSIRHDHPSTLHLWWARRPLSGRRIRFFNQRTQVRRLVALSPQILSCITG
jgi:putative DNA methylase